MKRSEMQEKLKQFVVANLDVLQQEEGWTDAEMEGVCHAFADEVIALLEHNGMTAPMRSYFEQCVAVYDNTWEPEGILDESK